MNLSYLTTSDKQLDAMSSIQDGEGAAVRKEIKRRKSIGYWDGSLKTNTNEAPEFVEARIIPSTVIMPTTRKVEKQMAGRGR